MLTDPKAWSLYPQYRWVFNKLEVALRLGYDAGPACVPVPKPNDYIIRPIYNLYGMGIGARKKFLDPLIHGEDITLHKYIPPGFFWCEYFEGDHYSVDYHKQGGQWVPISAVIGYQTSDALTRFSHWQIIDPPNYPLPDILQDIDVDFINVESKEDKIFEIHLRGGNDELWGYPKNTILYPVWRDESRPDLNHLPFKKNYDCSEYDADGHLSDVRVGYYIDTSEC